MLMIPVAARGAHSAASSRHVTGSMMLSHSRGDVPAAAPSVQWTHHTSCCCCCCCCEGDSVGAFGARGRHAAPASPGFPSVRPRAATSSRATRKSSGAEPTLALLLQLCARARRATNGGGKQENGYLRVKGGRSARLRENTLCPPDDELKISACF